MECRVGPLKRQDPSLLADYDDFFSRVDVSRIPLTAEVFDLATGLRAEHGFRTPDALHLAAAIAHGCKEFWTNDRRLVAAGDRIAVVVLP